MQRQGPYRGRGNGYYRGRGRGGGYAHSNGRDDGRSSDLFADRLADMPSATARSDPQILRRQERSPEPLHRHRPREPADRPREQVRRASPPRYTPGNYDPPKAIQEFDAARRQEAARLRDEPRSAKDRPMPRQARSPRSPYPHDDRRERSRERFRPSSRTRQTSVQPREPRSPPLRVIGPPPRSPPQHRTGAREPVHIPIQPRRSRFDVDSRDRPRPTVQTRRSPSPRRSRSRTPEDYRRHSRFDTDADRRPERGSQLPRRDPRPAARPQSPRDLPPRRRRASSSPSDDWFESRQTNKIRRRLSPEPNAPTPEPRPVQSMHRSERDFHHDGRSLKSRLDEVRKPRRSPSPDRRQRSPPAKRLRETPKRERSPALPTAPLQTRKLELAATEEALQRARHDAHRSIDQKAGSTAKRAPPTPTPPAPLDRIIQLDGTFASGSIYERIGQVGEGTYGKVYKAKNVLTSEFVALKRIRMEQERDGFPITSTREIKILQHLRHSGIVSLHEMMIERGNVYMVFEYMDHDLTGLLAHPTFKFSPANVKDLARQLFAALGYLHHQRVLHRDLKGSNILLDRQGTLKLADFGLARFFSPKLTSADYTNRVITLWFRPPELLLGATAYAAAVDIWSAGCILMEMFTGEPLFPGEDELKQLELIYGLFGAPTVESWPGVERLPWFELLKVPTLTPAQPRHRQLPEGINADDVAPGAKRFDHFFAAKLSPEAARLIKSVLCMNPADRPSAEACLQHAYFTTEAPASERVNLDDVVESHEWDAKIRKREERRKRQSEGKALARPPAYDPSSQAAL